MHSFSANAHAKVKHILSNTFPKLIARPEGKMIIFNGTRPTTHDPRPALARTTHPRDLASHLVNPTFL